MSSAGRANAEESERGGAPGAPGDEPEAPPWPGMVRLGGGVVRVPACALWAEHESYAAACWIERQAAAADERNAVAPTVAQLIFGLGTKAIAAAAGVEQTSSAITVAGLEGWREPDSAELQLGAAGVAMARSGAAAPQVRRMAPLDEGRRPWRQLVRPCAPRGGRGEHWPVVSERLGKSSVDEPVLLDRGDMVAQVYEEGGWTLVATGADDHALSWVPSDALDEWVDEWVGAWLPVEEDDDGVAAELGMVERASGEGGERGEGAERGEQSGEAGAVDELGDGGRRASALASSSSSLASSSALRSLRLAGEPPPAARKLRRGTSDAPLYDAILALAEASTARLAVREARGHAPPAPGLQASAELWPALTGELLEAWAEAGVALQDERLAELSAIDVVLLAVAVAPALDRATMRRYRALAAPEPLTAGLVIDLAGGSAATRVRVGRRLARELPLRAGEVVLIDGGQIPSVTSDLAVAPWVIAACYGM